MNVMTKFEKYIGKRFPNFYNEYKRKILKKELIKSLKNGEHIKFKNIQYKLSEMNCNETEHYILEKTLKDINDKIPIDMWGYAYHNKKYFDKIRYYLCKEITNAETEETCSICLDIIYNFGNTKTNCNHNYHKHCLVQWKYVNNTCPLCRTKI